MDTSPGINLITPCGLNCGMCAFYENGEIRQHAERLNELLSGFEHLAPLLTDWRPEFSHYTEFSAILKFLCSGYCPGCRVTRIPDPLAGCSYRTCSTQKGVIYCGICSEFPCPDAPKRYPDMAFIWKKNSKRIQEIGVEAYFEEIKNKIWYKEYEKDSS